MSIECLVPLCDSRQDCVIKKLATKCSLLNPNKKLPITDISYNLGACQEQKETLEHIERLTEPEIQHCVQREMPAASHTEETLKPYDK